MTTLRATTNAVPINTDHIDFSDVGMGQVVVGTPSPTLLSLNTYYSGTFEFIGSGFTYDFADKLGAGSAPTLTGGEVTGLLMRELGFAVAGFSIPAATMSAWIEGYPQYAFNLAAFAGADSLAGAGGDDVLRGDAGNDTILGGAGDDVLDGGTAARPRGSGVPPAPASDGANYLRGDAGDDSIIGGAAFDDINGNQGNDTAHGDGGDDWVVGGKDDDAVYGDDGNDIVYGNLGNDTCDGGGGNDLVRGGQGDDSLSGGHGDDWLSGDLGSDTISGGAGADTFHSFGAAGLDRVTDFNRAEGDRVQLDPGTSYTVNQSGEDVVISLGGGGQVVLVGVGMSSLTGDWIFAA